MKVTFLGTGTSQGIPVIGSNHPVCSSDDPRDKRLRVSVMINWDEYCYVIDCGPDFRQQMLTNKVQKIDGILFTHEHADHTAGLDDIRPFYFKQGNLPIYAHIRVLRSLEKRFDYIFVEPHERYPGAPEVDPYEVNNDVPIELGGIEVIPVNVWHHNLQVFGYRFDKFAYLTDVKTIDKSELEKLKGIDTLVINALRIEPHISHLNLDEALLLIDKIKPKRAYLTHISHMLGFHSEVEKILPDNVYLAYDNLTIEV